MGFFWIPGGAFFGFLGIVYSAFLIWMIYDCALRDPDRGIWIIVMLFLQPLGAIVYFFARYVPRNDFRRLKQFVGQFQTRELRQREIAARQIGNPYHWIQLAEKQREMRRFEDAAQSYREALDREPTNLQAKWGLALCLEHEKQPAEALPQIDEILAEQPDYKFGDVSLARGRLLMELERWQEAQQHLAAHVDRWRQPEGLYRLAQCLHRSGNDEAAREQVRALIMDIEGSPAAIARQQNQWKRKGKQLEKRLS